MTTCNICAENLNKSTRLKVECPYCHFDACRLCWGKWFLDETNCTCMNPTCRKDWTRQHLKLGFTAKFITKDLKEHREQVLFDQERALLPATQPFVEAVRLKDRHDTEVRDIQKEITALREKMIKVDRVYILERRALTGIDVHRNERNVFVRACPDQDCRGFLSSQWKCGICDKWSCPECHEVKGLNRDAEHVCDPDTVATAQLLANDTKSCPTCGMGIFKIEGCDQMWCTQCHTAFSFRTGRLEANIHNPHYYEWMRRNGGLPRQAGDEICGRGLNNQMLDGIYNKIRTRLRHLNISPNTSRELTILTDVGRSTIHLNLVELVNYRVDRVVDNQELRIDYLLNKITEDEFKTVLQRREKMIQKKREIHNILRLIIDTITDIIYRFNEQLQDTAWVLDFSIIEEIHAIMKYADECFDEISKTYDCKKYTLSHFGFRYRVPAV